MSSTTMSSPVSPDSSSRPLASFAFPRTGKRGVPQQFPRRLYEMLDSETRLLEAAGSNHPKVIAWSDSGKAFRIFNVSEFSASVLPKYFRTKKFSSFQRNLNLYGFAKVRRGPESDMYAHPSFIRGQPLSLLHLRKMTSAARRGRSASSSADDVETTLSSPVAASSSAASATTTTTTEEDDDDSKRIVSPSPSSPVVVVGSDAASSSSSRTPQHSSSIMAASATTTTSSSGGKPLMPELPGRDQWPPRLQQQQKCGPLAPPPQINLCRKKAPNNRHDRGKLDLLALALEQEAAFKL